MFKTYSIDVDLEPVIPLPSPSPPETPEEYFEKIDPPVYSPPPPPSPYAPEPPKTNRATQLSTLMSAKRGYRASVPLLLTVVFLVTLFTPVVRETTECLVTPQNCTTDWSTILTPGLGVGELSNLSRAAVCLLVGFYLSPIDGKKLLSHLVEKHRENIKSGNQAELDRNWTLFRTVVKKKILLTRNTHGVVSKAYRFVNN